MQLKSRLALTTAIIAAAASAQAATLYWTGDQDIYWNTLNSGNSNWSTSATENVELQPARAPASGDDLNFYSTGAINLATNLSTSTSYSVPFHSLSMSGTSAVSITGLGSNDVLHIGSGGLTVTSGAGQLSISARVGTDAVQDWRNDSSNDLVLSGIVAFSNKVTLKSGTLTYAGTSTFTLAGTLGVTTGTTFKHVSNGMSNLVLSLEGGTVNGNGAGLGVAYLAGTGGTFTNLGASNDLTLDFSTSSTPQLFSGSIPAAVRDLAVRGYNAAGTQILTGISSYTRNTYIGNSNGKTATLQLDAGNDRLPTGTSITLGYSAATATTTAKLVLGGATSAVNQTVAGLSSYNNSFDVVSVAGGNASTSTLTVNNSVANAFYGVLGGFGNGDNLALTKSNNGTLTLYGINTYAGDTTVNAGTLALADNAGLKFYIGASGVNNQITGSGTVQLDGDFTFDLTNASQTTGDSWNIVDVGTLNETFGATFTVNGFTEDANVWTLDIDGTKKYEFSESTGELAVVAIPEPTSALLLLTPLLMLRRRRGRHMAK